eukprot:g16652.t1
MTLVTLECKEIFRAWRKFYTVYDAEKKRIGFGRAKHKPTSFALDGDHWWLAADRCGNVHFLASVEAVFAVESQDCRVGGGAGPGGNERHCHFSASSFCSLKGQLVPTVVTNDTKPGLSLRWTFVEM